MPVYEIDQYVLYAQKYRIEASTEAEAIKKLFRGECEGVDNAQEYIEICEEFGLSIDEYPELGEELEVTGAVIPSIHSIQMVE
jgi:hypothetical protein